MAADAQMMSHFYSPLHHMWGSSLHHRSYPPSDPGKYPGQQYPDQKYPPSEPGYPSEAPPPSSSSHLVQEQKHHLPTSSSPSSSPHTNQNNPALPQDANYPPPLLPPHDPRYITPPGQLSPQDMKHEANTGEEKEISQPEDAPPPEEKVCIMYLSLYFLSCVFLQVETNVYPSDYSKVEYNGYGGYQQTDLGHPGYGGYSTAGPFPLTSPLSRPRSSKAKSQSGEIFWDFLSVDCKSRF